LARSLGYVEPGTVLEWMLWFLAFLLVRWLISKCTGRLRKRDGSGWVKAAAVETLGRVAVVAVVVVWIMPLLHLGN